MRNTIAWKYRRKLQKPAGRVWFIFAGTLEHDPRPTRNHRFPICRYPRPLSPGLNGSSAAGNAVENVIRHAPRCVLVESWPPVTFRRDVMATQRRGRISVSWFAALGFFIVEQHCYAPGEYTYSFCFSAGSLIGGKYYGWFNTGTTELDVIKAVLSLHVNY